MFDGVNVPLLKINNNDSQNLRDNHIFHDRQMEHSPHKKSQTPLVSPAKTANPPKLHPLSIQNV